MPLIPEVTSVTSQAAANIYLQLPSLGGSLQIWSEELTKEEYEEQAQDSYGLQRSSLPSPTISIMPKVGDLIIFNSKKLHAISIGVGSRRITMSCFIGYGGPNAPLQYWS